MSTTDRVGGVVIGVLMGLRRGAPLVVFPGNRRDVAVVARSTVDLGDVQVGAQVALVFEDGDVDRLLVIGRILTPEGPERADEVPGGSDGQERTSITAEETIELRVGKASLVMHADGRITMRGTSVVSQASGPNRVRGGSVHLN